MCSDASASHISSLTHKRRSQSHSHCTTFTSVRPVLLRSIIRQGHLSTISPGVPMEKDLSGVGLNSLCRRQCGETRRALSSIRTRAPDSAAFFPKYASRSALAAAGPLSRCEETKGLHLHFRHLRTHTRGNSEGSKNRSEKFRDIVLVTTQNFHRHTLSVPPRLFASHLSPHDRECPSSQKIFPTQSLYAPATSTQPQRRNTDVWGRSYHILKLFTPRQIRRFGRIRRYAQIWWSGA